MFFFVLFCCFFRIWLTKCPQTENKKEQKRSCRRENRKMSFVFFVVGPPPPPPQSMGCKQQFIEWYLKNSDDLSNDKLDLIIALAGKECKCVVSAVINQLSEHYKVQGPCLPKPYKYLLQNSNLYLCKQQDKDLFEKLFDLLRSLPDEHIRWTFDLHRKSCEEIVPHSIDKSGLDLCTVTGLLPSKGEMVGHLGKNSYLRF